MSILQPSPFIVPFPGLRAFRADEDYLFFGREEQTMELLSRLGSQRFVAVVGTSGSGKSSLVRCGLLSELLGGKMLGAGAAWEVAVTHPGGNPLGLLTEALLDAELYDRRVENARENLLATLGRSHFGLVEAIKQARSGIRENSGAGGIRENSGAGTNFLLVVDQFEEIFRFHEAGQTQQEMANEFVSLLLQAAAQKDVPIYIVLTMRSDFIGECGQFEGLAEAVNRGEFLIPRLTREQYKRVIEGPIRVAGGQIAPRLLQRLLNDLGQQADQLPCLQHALMRTWNVWAEKGDSDALDLDDYQRVGRMSEALSLHADEIYSSLAGDRQRELCAGLFKALTVQESENRGIRRPQRLGRLCKILDVRPDELLPIIDAFRRPGVTFLMPSQEVELNDRTIIDISHESLMRVWTRLRSWVEEEAQAAGIYLRLSESAALYEQGKAGLYRDPELGIALAWQQARAPNAAWAERYRPGFDAAMAFLKASQEAGVAEEQAREAARQRELEQARQLAEVRRQQLDEQRRAARKLRQLIAGVAGVALVAALACVAALVARHEASRLAEIARQNEKKAEENAAAAQRSQRATAEALAVVESQKEKVAASLKQAETAGSEARQAARQARAAEEEGRKLLYTTDMRLAPFVWKDDRTTAEQLRTLLAKHIPDEKDEGGRMQNDSDDRSASSLIPHPSSLRRPDLRGFEWHYYQHLLERSAAVFSGHAADVAGAALASDGRLVTLDANGQVRRWDLGSEQEDEARRRDLPDGPGAQLRVLSPDGRLAALAGGNNVHVFDASTGKEAFQVNSAGVFWRRLIFSRDNDRLVIVDDKIRWLNAASGEPIAAFDQKFDRVESLALSADGLTLAVVGYRPTGHQFSIFRLDAAVKTVTPLAKDITFGGTMRASAMSPDGRRIAVGAALSGAVFIFDTATGRELARHASAHASFISAMAFSADGARLATADAEGTIKIWAEAQQLSSKSTALLTLKGHQGAIAQVGFSSDGKRLASASADKTARVWDLENAGAAIRRLESYSNSGSFVARFSPDGQLIAAANPGSNSVRLWDAATGRPVRELAAGDRSRARESSGPGIPTNSAAQGRVYSVAFSPTDNRLLAVGYGGQADVSYVALWDIDAAAELARLPGATDLPDFAVNENTGAVGALAFSPDGKYLVAGFGSKNMLMREGSPTPLKVWEVASRRLIRRLKEHTGFCVSLDFSKDGALVASGSRDGTAIVWSTETWKALDTLQNPDQDSVFPQISRRGMVEDVAFSPDGKTLAMASREGNVHLWDVAGGQLLATLKGHSSAVTAVVFSPDGRTLASGSGDQTVRLWNVETRRELMQLGPGGVELGEVQTLAFSPDGRRLLAGGGSTAFYSTAPVVWNDPDRAAEKLRRLLESNADFQGRIQMLSENLRLPAALEKLSRERPGNELVQAALAATRANLFASRQQWQSTAEQAFGAATSPVPEKQAGRSGARESSGRGILANSATGTLTSSATPEAWLRTPGLLRLATALLHENRPAEAAALLEAGAKRRAQDPAASRVIGFGFRIGVGQAFQPDARQAGKPDLLGSELGAVRIESVFPGSPAARAKLLAGDVFVKVNGTNTTDSTAADVLKMLEGGVGTKARLTVRHPGRAETEDVELVKANHLVDGETARLFSELHGELEKRLAEGAQGRGQAEGTGHSVQGTEYRAGLLELRAELAGQESEYERQVADYTAAIAEFVRIPGADPADAVKIPEGDKTVAGPVRAPGPDLARLYRRRGDAFVKLQKWPEAIEDYARVVTDETTDEELLSNQAQAQAELLLAPQQWTVLKPTEMKSEAGATLTLLDDGSILASGTNPDRDVYTVVARPGLERITAIRLEALPDPTLPHNGPGRFPGNGNFSLNELRVASGDAPVALSGVIVDYDEFRDSEKMIDGKIDGSAGWANAGNDGAKNAAVVSTQIQRSPDDNLKIELYFSRSDVTQHNLGRFRLSVSDDPKAFERESHRYGVLNLADPWQKLAAAHRLQGNQQAIDQLVERHPKSAGLIGDLFTQGNDEEKDWYRAVEIYSVGLAFQPDARQAGKPEQRAGSARQAGKPDLLVELLSKRARAYEALQNWESAAADWSRAATGNPDEAKLLADFARRLAAGGQARLASERFETSQALYERSLAADRENDVVAAELAQLLFDKIEAKRAPDWVPLKPAETTTESGTKLTFQEDGSVLVGWASPTATPTTPDESTPESMVGNAHPTSWQPGPQPIQALRIETSTHKVPPTKGAGLFNEYQIIAASMASSRPGALRGRYVRLDLPGDNRQFPRYPDDGDKKTINLAELQVFQGDQNIALRQKARQSSDYDGDNRAENAVDGNTGAGFGLIAHTRVPEEGNDPWWEVDLGSEQAIDRIVIWNRADVNLYARMNHFRVRVLDDSRKVVFERAVDRAPNPSTEIVRPVFLAETSAAPLGENQPLTLTLPLDTLNDAPTRFRVSVAGSLADLGPEEIRQQAMKNADVAARLAAAYAADVRHDEALGYFNAALEGADGYAARKPIVELAARFDDVVSALAQERPDDSQWQLAWARNLAQRGRQRLAEKQPAEAQADLEKSGEIFTRLRTNDAQAQWTVLKPIEWKSTGGEQFAVESDGSLFVDGPNPSRAVYTLKFEADLPTVTAIRLETIPDPRLPDGGAGRYGNGNFHLSELTAIIVSDSADEKPKPLDISSVIADIDVEGLAAKNIIDGNPWTRWDTYPKMREAHWVVFGLKSPARIDGRWLSITLDSGITPWGQHGLGRFRLSATGDAEVLHWAPLRQDLTESEVLDVYTTLAAAHAQQGHTDQAAASFAEALGLAADRAGKAKIIAAAAPLDGVLDKLAERVAGDGQFQAELARHYAEQGNAPLADAARAKARALFEAKLAQEPDTDVGSRARESSGPGILTNSATTWAVELAELLLPPFDPQTKMMVPTSEAEAVSWRFTTTQPPADWTSEEYDDSAWTKGPGAFGGNGSAPGVSLRTVWNTSDIWLRRTFEWKPDPTVQAVLLRVIHDDGFELFLNGEQVFSRPGYTGSYVFYALDAKTLSLLRPGNNTLAVHCQSTSGPQFIDAGLHGERLAAVKITDPWAKLAAAYHAVGDQPALDRLLTHHPSAASGVGDLFAADQDWERAAAEYGKAITPEANDAEVFAKRAEAYEKLQLWEQAIADWGQADEFTADKNKRYAGYPCLIRRAQLYDRLRQFDKALADYNRVVERPNSGTDPLIWRSSHWAQRGQWKPAADDYRRLWNRREPTWYGEWHYARDRALLNLLAGDSDGYRQAAAELLTRTEKIVDGDSSKWLVYVLISAPGMIGDANRARLTAAADRIDPWWNPRLKAALLFRGGEFKQAAELFDSNGGGPAFEFLAAMAQHQLDRPDRARQLFSQASAWIEQQRDNDPGGSDSGSRVPRSHGWQDWAVYQALQREAARTLAGKPQPQPAGATARPARDEKP